MGSAGAGARGAGGIYDAVCLRLGDEVRTALLLLRRLSLLTVTPGVYLTRSRMLRSSRRSLSSAVITDTLLATSSSCRSVRVALTVT